MAKHQKSKPSPRQTNIALFALIFIVILLIFSKLIHLAISVTQPITNSFAQPQSIQNGQYKQQTWNGKTPINIIIKASDISILNYDPRNHIVTVLTLPSEAYFQLPKGYGFWPLSSIYALGQEETPSRGAQLLKDSLSNLLALPMDRIVLIDSSQDSKQVIDLIHQNALNSLRLANKVQSDLTPWEAIQISFALGQIRSDKITYLDLSQSSITESKLLPDSSRVLGIDKISLDLFIRDKLIDDKITQEGISVAIYNATNHQGLAQDATRVVSNLGGNVITAGNTEISQPKSAILISNGDKGLLTKSATYERLMNIFAPQCAHQNCRLSDPKVDTSRAQIIIVLGEDFYTTNYQHS